MTIPNEYKNLVKRTRERYAVRELPGCFVVNGNSGSIVVYRTMNGSDMTVCLGDKRENGEGDEVDRIIDKFCK